MAGHVFESDQRATETRPGGDLWGSFRSFRFHLAHKANHTQLTCNMHSVLWPRQPPTAKHPLSTLALAFLIILVLRSS